MGRIEVCPGQKSGATHTSDHDEAGNPDFTNWSRQVNWLTVHLFVQPYLDAVGSYPMAGSPAWRALPDSDPKRWAALLDASQHWALRVDTCQEAMAEASRDISAAADWSQVATEMVQYNSFYAARPWLRRVAS